MSRALGFGLRFVILFAVLTTAFEASRGTALERFVVEDAILSPTARLINLITPGERVTIVDRTLISIQGSSLHVTRGCEGVEMFLLLIAAIATFPASMGRRIKGLLWGAVLAYLLSLVRLMALHYVLQYWPQAWESAHGLILPLGPIILLALFFLRWSSQEGDGVRLRRDGHAM